MLNKKGGADPDKHKGVWTDVSVAEIKAYYGILVLMDIMNFERDELYWSCKDILAPGFKSRTHIYWEQI